MKVMLESTETIVELIVEGHAIPARIWQGESENGVPVHAYVTRIVPEIEEDHPEFESLTAQFTRDLTRCAKPRPTVEAIPLRLIL